MNTTNHSFELPTLNTLACNLATATVNVFAPEGTLTTADFLLRVASRRQVVRAMQALRRR